MRRATITTTHDDADLVAGAVAPDHTEEMSTATDGDAVRTRIERPTTGGLAATVDDYVVNLVVAAATIERAEAQGDERADTDTHDT